MSRSSIVRQIEEALDAIYVFGELRSLGKKDGTAKGKIYSSSSLRTHKQRCCTSFKGLPCDQQVRLLRDWTVAHTTVMVAQWHAQGLHDVTIKNRLSSLRKHVYGMRKLGWTSAQPEELVPDALYQDLQASPPRGSYSTEQADALLAALEKWPKATPDMVCMMRLIRVSGLRHTEAAGLREADIDRQRGTIYVRRSTAKGGRERSINFSPDDPDDSSDSADPSERSIHFPDDSVGHDALLEAINTIPPGRNFIWADGLRMARRLRDIIHTLCEQMGIVCLGLHGLRATCAEEYLRRHLEMGLEEDEIRDRLTRLLGHGRRSVTYQYVPRLTPRKRRRRR